MLRDIQVGDVVAYQEYFGYSIGVITMIEVSGGIVEIDIEQTTDAGKKRLFHIRLTGSVQRNLRRAKVNEVAEHRMRQLKA